MAETTELDFALASFGEFAKMWRNKDSSRLGTGHVELVANLGPPGDQHESHHFQAQRRKTPAQLIRSEKRRQEYFKKKNEAVKVSVVEMIDKNIHTAVEAVT